MTTIYVLTEGEYSDYRIVALYSTLDLAKKAQALCPSSNIEEYGLDELEIPDHPQGYSGWQVSIKADTNTIHFSYQQDVLGGYFTPEECYYDNSRHPNAPPLFVVRCWARDEEHAEKIALDKFYQWKWEKENGIEND